MHFLIPDDLFFTVTLFVIGIISGALNAMGGSGGLVILSYMMGMGVPPAVALGTARIANIIPQIIAVKKFDKAGHLDKSQLIPFIIMAVIFGSLGTFIIIKLPEDYIYKIMGILMLVIGPLILIEKDFGLKSVKKSYLSKCLGYVLYGFSMIYAGFLGAGASIIIVYTMIKFLGMSSLNALATSTLAWIAMSFISSAIFLYYGAVDYQYFLVILISMSIGSWIGATLAIKKGSRLINICVSVFAIIMGGRILFWV